MAKYTREQEDLRSIFSDASPRDRLLVHDALRRMSEIIMRDAGNQGREDVAARYRRLGSRVLKWATMVDAGAGEGS